MALILLKEYLIWHYSEAVEDIFYLWRNFSWFFYHYFSIPLLFKTIFSPFYRIQTSYDIRDFNLEDIASTFALNVVSRIIGFFIRSLVLIIGTGAELIILLSVIPALLIWILMPGLLIASIILGASAYFSLS